jgi:hypothetical protein
MRLSGTAITRLATYPTELSGSITAAQRVHSLETAIEARLAQA